MATASRQAHRCRQPAAGRWSGASRASKPMACSWSHQPFGGAGTVGIVLSDRCATRGKAQQFEQPRRGCCRELLIYLRENSIGMRQDFTMKPGRPESPAACHGAGAGGKGLAMNEPIAGPQFQLARDSLQAHAPSPRLTRFRRRGYQRFRLFMAGIDLAFLWKRRWFFITMIARLPADGGADARGPHAMRARSCWSCR